MKRRIEGVKLLGVWILFITTACGTGSAPTDRSHINNPGGLEKMEAEPIEFTIEEEESLPLKVKETVEQIMGLKSENQQVVTTEEKSYFIIALGERRTGGYQVEIRKIEQCGETLHVYAKENPPAKGAVLIQVISYPLTVVSVQGTFAEDAVMFHVDEAEVDAESPSP